MSYIPNATVFTKNPRLSGVLGMLKVRDIVEYAKRGCGEKGLLMENAIAVISN